MTDLPNVHGLTELKRMFDGIVSDSKRALRKMGSAGGKYMRDRLREGTPKAKGPHRRGRRLIPEGGLQQAAFYFFDRKSSNANQAVFVVKYRARTGFYAAWVDQGHRNVPRNGKAHRTIRSRRQQAQGRTPAHPFFEQAVTGAAEGTAQKMVDAGNAEVAKIIAEHNAG